MIWFILGFLLSITTGLAKNPFHDSDYDLKPEIEYDPDFEDDFLDIEQGNNYSANKEINEIMIKQHDILSEHGLKQRDDSLSLFLGMESIASVSYLSVFPEAKFTWRNLYNNFGLPLRFPIYDHIDNQSAQQRKKGFVGAENLITPRPQDFRNFFDLQRIVRHFEINRPKDKYFLRLSRNHVFTLGRGELAKNMETNLLYDFDHLFMSGHLHLDDVSINGFLGPLIKANILGINIAFMPLLKVNQVPLWLRDLHVDISYVNDLFAPNQFNKDGNFYLLDNERRLLKRDDGTAQGLVIGTSLKYYPINWLSLNPYLSFGQMWLTGIKNNSNETSSSYGGALHFGHDLNIEFATTKPSLLLFKTEGRFFSPHYFPSYFGSSYFLDRQIFIKGDNNDVPKTKSQYLYDITNTTNRFGYILELNYVYDESFITSLAYENARILKDWSQIPTLRKLRLMSSILGLDIVRIYLSYQATHIKHLEDLFDFSKSRGLLSLKGQLKLTPFWFFDAWVKHSFGVYDMFPKSTENNTDPVWLSDSVEKDSVNFGIGFSLMTKF